MVVLEKPLDRIYLAASAAMALISAVDGLDSIAFTATEERDWYLDEAAKAMKEGRIKYAGKYSQPDYEMLLDEGCDLAVESTMILHSPGVQEKLEGLDIPVFIDQSSYESHPLGRSEWIKVYGALLDKQDEAKAFFDDQKKIIADLEGIENTGKTVAFFYMNSQDQAVVRASDDYIPRMIEIAGGNYIFEDLENPNEESRSAVVKMSMEEFYDKARDADYLIYNASIESPLRSIDDLTEKSELFTRFKAVREGNVWTTDKYLYQATDLTGQLLEDIHIMLTEGDRDEMTFLKKVPAGGSND
jgi:iron complex transport system substrate-binding protein